MRKTKIYFDENISHYLVKGLAIIEKSLDDVEVYSIPDVFGTGSQDEDWIPVVGAEGGVVVTQDLNIHRTRRQRELYEKHHIGVFFIVPPSKKGYLYWEMVEYIIRRWPDIKLKCIKDKPFAYRCTSRNKLEKM